MKYSAYLLGLMIALAVVIGLMLNQDISNHVLSNKFIGSLPNAEKILVKNEIKTTKKPLTTSEFEKIKKQYRNELQSEKQLQAVRVVGK